MARRYALALLLLHICAVVAARSLLVSVRAKVCELRKLQSTVDLDTAWRYRSTKGVLL